MAIHPVSPPIAIHSREPIYLFHCMVQPIYSM
uniref:Uncharacterized protein n=1 Tax=Arundo donax TaxID=35708 RepID=A0A0A8Y9X5_ARUDO